MHSHLARDRGVPSLSCSPVYDHGQKLSCELPVLKATHKKAVTYDSDHIYPGTFTEETPEVRHNLINLIIKNVNTIISKKVNTIIIMQSLPSSPHSGPRSS